MSRIIYSWVNILFLIIISYSLSAQCPSNIDFEKGNLESWLCYKGRVTRDGDIRISLSGKISGHHDIESLQNGDEKDYYGGFSKKYPGEGKYSLKLGNDGADSEAEGVSYTFTIPTNNNDFSLIYHYAIVFEDIGHLPRQQPRVRIKTYNETDNQWIICASYDYIANSSLPGFLNSAKPSPRGSSVICKDWSAACINLSGLAGKTITVTFTSADCALGDHFGYCYLNFGSECSTVFPGSVYCPKDTAINLKAPPGFQSYKWFNNIGTVLGTVEPDEYNKNKPYNKVVLKDENAMALLKQTRATASINAQNYNAIYIVGGKGAMFDLPYDPSLQEIITIIDSKEGVISSVCHGSAAFVNVKLNDGSFLIAGKKIAGFSNQEEIMFGKKWKPEFPFLLEDKLTARGCVYEKADLMLPHVSIAGRLITGQNPYSTNASAEEVVKALNNKVISRKPYVDEKSMNLVKKAINENAMSWAREEILKDKESFDIELIAAYGYYKLLGAEDDIKVIKLGLDIVELVIPYYYKPTLQLEQAKAYKKLGDKAKAKKLLEELLQKEPNLESVKKALTDL